jgi:hypothetical protein
MRIFLYFVKKKDQSEGKMYGMRGKRINEMFSVRGKRGMRTNDKKERGGRGECNPITFNVVGYTSRFIRLAASHVIVGEKWWGKSTHPPTTHLDGHLISSSSSVNISVCVYIYIYLTWNWPMVSMLFFFCPCMKHPLSIYEPLLPILEHFCPFLNHFAHF